MHQDRVRWGGVHFRAVIKSWGPGIIPNYYECGLRLISLENRRKIEPKEIPSCLIPLLLVVYTQQLKILVTTLHLHPVVAQWPNFVTVGCITVYNYSMSACWIWVGYNHLISNKRAWNNNYCFIKNAHKMLRNLPNFICKNKRFSACF